MRVAQKTQKTSGRGYLDGQMLIAMPAMRDERFLRSVIYVCAHSSEGAMGIVVNQPAANINFSDLLVQLEVIPAADLIQLPRRAGRSEEHTSELQSRLHLVCRLLLEKKKKLN